jgi:hypothetical protein
MTGYYLCNVIAVKKENKILTENMLVHNKRQTVSEL